MIAFITQGLRTTRWLVVLVAVTGCEPEDGPTSLLSDDWRSTYLEVRGCRASPDHDLEHVALWMDPASKVKWDTCVDAFPEGGSTCTEGFPEGATFVKPQYLDGACTQLLRISIAKKDRRFAETGGWHWQEIAFDGERESITKDGAQPRCVGCHATCDGFDQRCYMDPDPVE